MIVQQSKFQIILFLLLLMLLSFGVVTAQDNAGGLSGIHIYFSEESSEASLFDRSPSGLSRMGGLLQQLGADMTTLNWHFDIPADADLVIIPGPLKDFSGEQMARLWVYLINGGKLLLFADPLAPSTSNGVTVIDVNRALTSGKGFFELTWADFGIRGRDDVLLQEDASGAPAMNADHQPNTDFVASVDSSSPITLDSGSTLAFFGARSIEYDASLQTYKVIPLIFAPEQYYGESAYSDFVASGTLEYNSDSDTPPSDLAVAVAAENTTYNDSRIVLIADRQFITNGGGLQTSPPNSANLLYPANVQFTLNAISWLLGTEQIVSIPLSNSTSATENATSEATQPAESQPEATPAS
jgi:hypothetical protein